MNEHGVTFEWPSGDPNDPWKLGESIGAGLLLPYLSRTKEDQGWHWALAANLAMAALLGTAARQAVSEVACALRGDPAVCRVCDNDE